MSDITERVTSDVSSTRSETDAPSRVDTADTSRGGGTTSSTMTSSGDGRRSDLSSGGAPEVFDQEYEIYKDDPLNLLKRYVHDTVRKSRRPRNTPLYQEYTNECRSDRILYDLSLDDRLLLISSLCKRLKQTDFRVVELPVSVTIDSYRRQHDLESLLKGIREGKDISWADPFFCLNILIQSLKTMPKGSLIPAQFITHVLIDKIDTFYSDLLQYIEDDRIKVIWAEIILLWKSLERNEVMKVREISQLFGKEMSKTCISDYESLNTITDTEVGNLNESLRVELGVDDEKLELHKQALEDEDEDESQSTDSDSTSGSVSDSGSDALPGVERFESKSYKVEVTTEFLRRTFSPGKDVLFGSGKSSYVEFTLKLDPRVLVFQHDDKSFELKYAEIDVFFHESRSDHFMISKGSRFNSVIIRASDEDTCRYLVAELLIRKRFVVNGVGFILGELERGRRNGNLNDVICNLLVSRNMSLLSALVDNYNTIIKTYSDEEREIRNKLPESLLILFHSRQHSMRIIRWLIYKEVSSGKNSSRTLFRSSSLSSKIIPRYGHLVGKNFLRVTLLNTILTLGRMKKTLDHTNVKKEVVRLKNMKKLRLLANEFIGKITLSTRDIPVTIRHVCRQIKKSTQRIFPRGADQALNNFLFLRFIVPAIISPVKYGVLSEEEFMKISNNDLKRDAIFRKNLVNISKLVQDVGNMSQVIDPSREVFREFVTKSRLRIHNFYELVTELNSINVAEHEGGPVEDSKIDPEDVEFSKEIIGKYFESSYEEIKDMLLHIDTRDFFYSFILDFLENLIEENEDDDIVLDVVEDFYSGKRTKESETCSVSEGGG